MEENYVLSRIIFETVVGSQAYGTNNANSDEDKVGIMIPGKEYFLGFKRVDQYQDFETDRVIYNLVKATKLMMENNPNMLDLLWAPERCIVTSTPYWERLAEKKDLFLSKKVRYTYSGYAISQLRRIKTHRKFLLSPVEKKPERKDFGLSDHSIFPTAQVKSVLYAAIKILVEERKHDFLSELDAIYKNLITPLLARYVRPKDRILAMEWIQLGVKSQAKAFQAVGTDYLKDEYVDIAQKEIEYFNAMQEWKQYQNWSKHRNKARAELEEKFGYDLKHASHLVRLMRMGIEALEKKTIFVDRTNIDAEELLEIRNGSWPFEKLEEYANAADSKMDQLYQSTELQNSPEAEKIEELCVEIISDYLFH